MILLETRAREEEEKAGRSVTRYVSVNVQGVPFFRTMLRQAISLFVNLANLVLVERR